MVGPSLILFYFISNYSELTLHLVVKILYVFIVSVEKLMHDQVSLPQTHG
jgi:hypothetical protein